MNDNAVCLMKIKMPDTNNRSKKREKLRKA